MYKATLGILSRRLRMRVREILKATPDELVRHWQTRPEAGSRPLKGSGVIRRLANKAQRLAMSRPAVKAAH